MLMLERLLRKSFCLIRIEPTGILVRMKHNQYGFGALGIIFAIIPVLVIGAVGAAVFVGYNFSHGCNKKRHEALLSARSQIDDFNKVTILSSHPNTDATIQPGGDCVDSEPYVAAYKTFDVNLSAGSVEDDISAQMTKQGFIKNHSDFTTTCNNSTASLQFTRGSTIVTVGASTGSNSGCQLSSGVIISETDFRTKTVSSVRADLRLPSN